MTFTGDAAADFEAFHFLADTHHFTDIFVTDNHRYSLLYWQRGQRGCRRAECRVAAPVASVRSIADLAGHKIGAQAGSLYAGRLRASLIDPGACRRRT